MAILFVAAATVVAQTTHPLTPAEQNIVRLSQLLNSSDEEVRRDALMQLAMMHRESASRVALPALNDASPKVRAMATHAILGLPGDEAVDALARVVTDKIEFVRREAAYALGKTHSRKATPLVVQLLQTDKEDGVRGAAAIALGELRDEASVPILSAVLAPETTQAQGRKARADKNAFVLRAAATALGRIKSRAGTPALISALGNKSYPDDVKREAAVSLGLIGDPAGYNALTNAAASNDPYLASAAQDSLKKLSK